MVRTTVASANWNKLDTSEKCTVIDPRFVGRCVPGALHHLDMRSTEWIPSYIYSLAAASTKAA